MALNDEIDVFLVDTLTDTDQLEVASGGTYPFQQDLLDVMGLYVQVAADNPFAGQYQSVVLTLDGSIVSTENGAPYSLFGDKAGDFKSGSISAGDHTLVVQLYSGPRGTGNLLTEYSVPFSLEVDTGPPPEAVDDTAMTEVGTPLVIDVLQNDGFSDDAIALSILDSAGNGSLDIVGGEILYTPNAGFVGGDTFTYSATGQDTTVTGSVSLDVLGAVSSSGATAEQLHLAWIDDAATTLTVVWRLDPGVTASEVQYRKAGDTSWAADQSALRESGTVGGDLYEATLRGLESDTEYEFRVRLDDGSWSSLYDARTAPNAGKGDFNLVFFADTGLIGRTDGLSTGTEQVLNEIAEIDPTLLLGGGDYAYYNTDKRFGSLDATIDAWFDQWASPLGQAPFMTTYGNHEVILGEGFSEWRSRFPQPENGLFNGQFYSFDVADTHFVSILLPRETDSFSSAELAWIEADIVAAQAAGADWIVPFMHASPYSDGDNHPSANQARNQLAPLFEDLDVDLVLTTHDQSYERTLPLLNGSSTLSPSTNVPTSNDLSTYYTEDDGVIWMKVSPSGKLSNKNGGFSPWLTEPAPDYTAVRSNAYHHFAEVSFDDAGIMSVTAYGVVGDGSDPIVIDNFQFVQGSRAAIATDDDASVVEDNSVLIDVLDNDDAGATLQSVGTPSSGTAVIENGEIRYTPGADFFGTATFTYQVLGTSGGTDTGSVTVDVSPVNDAPEDLALSSSAVSENAAAGAFVGLITAFDPDGDDILFTVDDARFTVNSSDQLVLAAGADLSGQGGEVIPISVTADDLNGERLTATFDLSITDGPSGFAIDLWLIDATTDQRVLLLTDGLVVNTSVLTADEFSIEAAVDAGLGAESVFFDLDGSTTRTENTAPYALFGDRINGTDIVGMSVTTGAHTISATAYSGNNLSGSQLAQVSLNFEFSDGSGGNDPVAGNDTATVVEDNSVLVDVLNNDTAGSTIQSVGTPSNGTAVIENGEIRYTPGSNFFGQAIFTYQILGTLGGTDTGTVTVDVTPVNDDPENVALVGDTISETAGAGAVIGSVSAFDPDVDQLIFTSDDTRFEINGSDQLVLAAGADLNGLAGQAIPVSITADDQNGGTTAASFNVHVTDQPTSPDFEFWLIDATTDLRLLQLTDGAVVDTSIFDAGEFSIEVVTDPSIGAESVQLNLAGVATRNENSEPYALFGDAGSDFFGQAVPIGAQTFTATAFSGNNLSGTQVGTDSVNFEFTTDPGNPSLFEAHFNVANQQVTANDGTVFLAGPGVSAGNIVLRNKSLAINGTQDDDLYDAYGFGQNFTFSINVPRAGTYDVDFLLAEVFHTSAGARVFDILLEGQQFAALDDIDIFTEAGGNLQATTLSQSVDVNDGTLDIQVIGSVDNALINAFSVFEQGTIA